MTQLILASQSPRRAQLLKESGFRVQIDPIKISEIIEENLNPEQVCLKISQSKMQDFRNARNNLISKDFLVITSDTIVAHNGVVFGKPSDEANAAEMLKQFSNSTHSVWTAVSLWWTLNNWTFDYAEETRVSFRMLQENDILEYLNLKSYKDKAGSYGIQDIPKDWIKKCDGSFANVMGFPIESFTKLLQKEKIEIAK